MTAPTYQLISDLHAEYFGRPLKGTELAYWFTRLQTFSCEQVNLGFERAHGDWVAGGRYGKWTLKDIATHARNAAPQRVANDQSPTGYIDPDCTRGCSYGIVNMEDRHGYSFVAHCDCKRGELERANGTKLGQSDGKAVTGLSVTDCIAKGAKVQYRGIEWSPDWTAWINDRRQEHLRNGLKPYEAQDKAVAEACHARVEARGGLPQFGSV